MNFEPIIKYATGIVVAAAIAGHLGDLNRWVYVATAKLLWESRTATWGSPHWVEKLPKSNKTQRDKGGASYKLEFIQIEK